MDLIKLLENNQQWLDYVQNWINNLDERMDAKEDKAWDEYKDKLKTGSDALDRLVKNAFLMGYNLGTMHGHDEVMEYAQESFALIGQIAKK